MQSLWSLTICLVYSSLKSTLQFMYISIYKKRKESNGFRVTIASCRCVVSTELLGTCNTPVELMLSHMMVTYENLTVAMKRHFLHSSLTVGATGYIITYICSGAEASTNSTHHGLAIRPFSELNNCIFFLFKKKKKLQTKERGGSQHSSMSSSSEQ